MLADELEENYFFCYTSIKSGHLRIGTLLFHQPETPPFIMYSFDEFFLSTTAKFIHLERGLKKNK